MKSVHRVGRLRLAVDLLPVTKPSFTGTGESLGSLFLLFAWRQLVKGRLALKECIEKLARGERLSEELAADAMNAMMEGNVSPVAITAYLTLLRAGGETIEELTGSARAMRAHAVPLEADVPGVIDTCGTGGDHSGTFNISTAAAFVAAAGGVPVAKHGNRAASSQTGSADVLGALGIAIDLPPDDALRCLREIGFCFLFAQSYHPAMRHVAPIRKELGFRTMFNILGPLTNPARPLRQVLGTPSLEIAGKMAHVLAALGVTHALVVHARDGLDEISMSGPTDVFEVRGQQVTPQTITPATFGLQEYGLALQQGGAPQDNAAIIRSILAGESGARRAVVVANAAAALYVGGRVESLPEGARLAEQLIDEGTAARVVERLVAFGQAPAQEVSA